MSLFDEVCIPERHAEVIADVSERLRERGGLWSMKQHEVPFAMMRDDAAGAARAIAADLRDQRYAFSPVSLRTAELDKKRELIVPVMTDLVVYHVVARALVRRIEAELPSSLMSFRRGRSAYVAHRKLASFVKAHRRATPDPKTRGLYVLKRDVRNYTDTIDVSDTSRLWALIEEHVREPVDAERPLGKLLRAVIRPTRADGSRPNVGVPTGSPLTPIVANLYLIPLDRALEALPNSFYARFGDDFLFATSDRDTAERASSLIDEHIDALGLEIHPSKRRNVFLNGAGPARGVPGFDGAASLDWLGLRAGIDGTFGLTTEKESALLEDISLRMRNALRYVGHDSMPVAATYLSAVVSAAIRPGHPYGCKNTGLLRAVCTDRAQIRRIDYRIALELSSLVTGIRGPRTFRKLSWNALREQSGLASVGHKRDAKGGKAG